jgi:hypothetical protein
VVLAHTNFMGGGHTLFMFLPFLFIVGGLVYISIAAGDRRQRRNRSVRVLPVGAQHPLSHVRAKMKPASPVTRQADQKPGQRPRSGPRWLTPL